MGIGFILVLASRLAFDAATEDPGERVIVAIRPGTAAALEEGSGDATLSGVRVSDGDTLVVVNMDSVSHRLGIITLAPGATLEIPITSRTLGAYPSSFNAAGSYVIHADGDSDLALMAFGSVLIGLPLGLVIAVAWTVARRLEHAP
jgi:hypothetical protein